MGKLDNVTETAIRLQSVLLKTNVPTSIYFKKIDTIFCVNFECMTQDYIQVSSRWIVETRI